MPQQTIEQDIRDEAAYAQKYGGGMVSLDFAVLDEWADRVAGLHKRNARLMLECHLMNECRRCDEGTE